MLQRVHVWSREQEAAETVGAAWRPVGTPWVACGSPWQSCFPHVPRLAEPSYTHAGMLMALGLTGHLRYGSRYG